MAEKNQNIKEFQFQTEMTQLLHLLTHSLYTHPEVFLRELISNASDALNKMHFASLTDDSVLGEDANLKIKIELDEKKSTFSIQDNGIGMSEQDLINNIGTIAKSGTGGFIDKLTGDQKKDLELIGQFGVGFYSVFMVADEVTVESRSYKEDQGYQWISKGQGSFSIEPIEKKDRGTKISFTLKKDHKEFAEKFRVESVIRKYSDFVSYPIEVNSEKVNQSQAIWSRDKKEVKQEEYYEFFKHISHQHSDPIAYLHFNVEAPAQFKSILFIPSEKDTEFFTTKLETKLHLYAKKVFIQDDCKDLLPTWLRFVHGVVDSEDLPLNVSREVTQNSPIMAKISKYLVRKLISEFKSWAKKDKEKYDKFWQLFGNIIKEGLHQDFENKEKLLELYRCYSSTSPDQFISLQEYVDRMKQGQEEIYYIYGKTQQIIETSPNLEYFKKNNIEVLYFYDEIDDFIFPSIGSYQEKKLVSVDAAEIKDEKKSDETNKQENIEELKPSVKKEVIEVFKQVLGDRVSDVIESKRLVDSACTLVAPKDAMNAHMERMMKMMNKEFTSSKKVLEINMNNILIQNISKISQKKADDPLITEYIEQLFEGASLQEGILEDVSKIPPRVSSIMEKASSLYLETLESETV